MSKCCACCVAAQERGELDHELGECPYPPCDFCQGESDEDFEDWSPFSSYGLEGRP